MKLNQLITPFALAFLLSACGNESNDVASSEKPNETVDSVKEDTQQKIYSLPSAMQMAAFLKRIDGKYSEELIKGNIKNPETTITSTQKALSLGVYAVDLGYTISYKQDQSAINYLVKVAKISDDLKITGAFKKETVDRFKSNISNTDSLSYITLSAFNDAGNYLTANNNKDIQYLIAAGSFVEGLYLSASVQKKEKKQETANAIGMQKLYLTTIMELLSPFSEKQPDVKALIAQLEQIKTVLDPIKIELVAETADAPGTIKDVEISDQQLEDLIKQVVVVRKSIIG